MLFQFLNDSMANSPITRYIEMQLSYIVINSTIMKSKHLIILFLIMTICLLLTASKMLTYTSNDMKYVDNPRELVTPLPSPDPKLMKILAGIEEINKKNAQIQSIFCEDMKITASQGFGVKMHGKIAYE